MLIKLAAKAGRRGAHRSSSMRPRRPGTRPSQPRPQASGANSGCVCPEGLTVTDGVRGGRARGQLGLGVLVADGAGQAGVQPALPVGVGVVQTLLAHRVVVVLAVRVHALAHGAHGARLAVAQHRVEEEVVVADADGIVGVGAGRLHPHQAGAERARPALLRVAVVP